MAAIVIGEVRDVSRFPSRDCFAAYDGTAPIEVSSGNRKACRLSRRGNRRLNRAIHMAAVTQVSHSQGRAYYNKKLAEGKAPEEALRSLRRQISDAIFTRLRADARRAPRQRTREGGRGTTLAPARPDSTPHAGSSDKPLPGPAPTLRPHPPPRAGLAIPRSLPPAVGAAARPGGAPAAKRGRTTWTRGKTAGGSEEGQESSAACHATAADSHFTRRTKDRRKPLTQRGFRYANIITTEATAWPGTLTDDDQFQATTFHAINFETTTPRGYPPEPIEVAVISLHLQSGQFAETTGSPG